MYRCSPRQRLVAIVSAFQRGAGDPSLERVADGEHARYGPGRHTADGFDPRDAVGAALIGKRLQRHCGGRRREGARAARDPGPTEVGGRPRDQEASAGAPSTSG